MNELFAWAQCFRLMTFDDGRGKIALAVMRHAERQLRLEIVGRAGERVF